MIKEKDVVGFKEGDEIRIGEILEASDNEVLIKTYNKEITKVKSDISFIVDDLVIRSKNDRSVLIRRDITPFASFKSIFKQKLYKYAEIPMEESINQTLLETCSNALKNSIIDSHNFRNEGVELGEYFSTDKFANTYVLSFKKEKKEITRKISFGEDFISKIREDIEENPYMYYHLTKEFSKHNNLRKISFVEIKEIFAIYVQSILTSIYRSRQDSYIDYLGEVVVKNTTYDISIEE